MHLRTVHRYYAAKPSPTLVRRDGGEGATRNHNIVVAVLVIFVVVAAIAIGDLLIKKIMSKVQTRTCRAKGQGTHLQGRSLRQDQRPDTRAFDNRNDAGYPSPQSDWRVATRLTTPASTHAASMAFSQSGHPSMPPHPAYRNDGFEPTQWASRPVLVSRFVLDDVPATRGPPQGNWI